ncbi:MAG: STAS domain-containing protein [Gammaproteobacteria bacterium]
MSSTHVYYSDQDGIHLFKLCGMLQFTAGSAFEQALNALRRAHTVKEIIIDLTEVDSIDSTMLGMIGQLGVNQQTRAKIVIAGDDIDQTLKQVGFDRFFIIVFNRSYSEKAQTEFTEFKPVREPKKTLEKRVQASHEWLSQIDAANAKAFKPVLDHLKRH